MMKFARTATVSFTAMAAMGSGAIASNSVRGSLQNGPDAEAQKDGAAVTPESRALWGKQYDTSYTEHCGCTEDFTKEIAAAQLSIVSGLSPLLFLSSANQDQRDTILLVLECTAKLGAEILRCLDCSCESAELVFGSNPSGEQYDSAYKQCCCDADTLKDIFISKMHEIAEIPDCILALGGDAFMNEIYAIFVSAFPTIEYIAKDNVLDGAAVIQRKLNAAKKQMEFKMATPEGEPCGDEINGGCATCASCVPEVGSIEPGQSIGGTLWNSPPVAGQDTDWFELDGQIGECFRITVCMDTGGFLSVFEVPGGRCPAVQIDLLSIISGSASVDVGPIPGPANPYYIALQLGTEQFSCANGPAEYVLSLELIDCP